MKGEKGHWAPRKDGSNEGPSPYGSLANNKTRSDTGGPKSQEVRTSSTASMSSAPDSTIGRFMSTGRSGVHCPELRAERSFGPSSCGAALDPCPGSC